MRFDIGCICGARLQGVRTSQSQVVTCVQCRVDRLVLPLSPLTDLAGESQSRPLRARRRWPWYLLAALMASFGLILLAIQLVPVIAPTATSESLPTLQRIDEHQMEGQSALAGGAYLRAASEFEAAVRLSERLALAPRERRRFVQWHRQSALLADLMAESPAESLRHAVGLPQAEWDEIVRRRYAGKSFVLDDLISRGTDGQYIHAFRIDTPGGPARIRLEHLELLHELPLTAPTRILFGMRIAALKRGSAGWEIEPQPDSGVLLTDPEVFAGLSLPADAELREVLKRQRAWLERP